MSVSRSGCTPRSASRDGLTLIELLVVISIIGILAAVLVVAVGGALERGYITETKTTVDTLAKHAESYKTTYMDYPPTYLEGAANQVNIGIESLLVHLNGEPDVFFHPDTKLVNTDGDSMARFPFEIKRKVSDLWELEDSWGNPIIYIASQDYESSFAYRTRDGKTLNVGGVKNPKTGDYYNPDGFQIRSLGPNEKDDGGEGDDICSWKNP
jgi:prepilin-type N-terminal cleavage/methylation domain-containing protein